MARCELTGKGAKFGRNVSHSNRKSSRLFEPNVQKVTLASEALRRRIPLRISTRALRSVQKHGGLDGFLLKTADVDLTAEALKLKRRVRRARSARRAS